jgi:hypothetical protein
MDTPTPTPVEILSDRQSLQDLMKMIAYEIVEALPPVDIYPEIELEVSCVFGGTIANMVESELRKRNLYPAS